MDLLEITFDSLKENTLIQTVEFEGEWYFSKDGLNFVYDNEFKFIDSVPIRIKVGNFYKVLEAISWTEIQEHVAHRRDMPSFKSTVSDFFGFKKR